MTSNKPGFFFVEDAFSTGIELTGKNVETRVFSTIDQTLWQNLQSYSFFVIIISAETLQKEANSLVKMIDAHHPLGVKLIVLSNQRNSKKDLAGPLQQFIYLVLPAQIDGANLADAAANAFESLRLEQEALTLQSHLEVSYQDVHTLTKVGQALASEHDFDTLIGMIITEAQKLCSADGGSIYLVERKAGHEKPTHLRFKKSALNLNADEFLLPLDKNSIAGYVAETGSQLIIDDAYKLSGWEDYHFNPEFDKQHNYYTKSIMCLPMKNHDNQVIGVIQLINRKRNFNKKLTVEEMKGDEVIAFDDKTYELAQSFAGAAAVAIENNLLIQDINNLFEGFVTASVTAIEQRDPTTSGHSARVAHFTVALAKAIDRVSLGNYSKVRFSKNQLREIRYASLLHDFGKVGVREEVLVKPKKLYQHELQNIQWRFRYLFKMAETEYLNGLVKLLKEAPADLQAREQQLKTAFEKRKQELASMFKVIEDANEPSILEDGNFDFLQRIAQNNFRVHDGATVRFLSDNELLSLSVRKGSLNNTERVEIESHVTHTYQFLIQIPWTADLKAIPEIAYKHHEKLDGTGYPQRIPSNDIPVQSKMMTISDIYDALTAWDRPYKKAIPFERALDILKAEAEAKKIDRELLNIFIETKAFRIADSAYNVSRA